jgi:hypothetical protein
MLEQLSKVNWAGLSHAYGPATDVPGQLHALASPDVDERNKARWELYCNICHQGTRFPASAYAVPFLFELLNHNDVHDKDGIIRLLLSLATGGEDLPFGFNPSEAFKDVEHLVLSPEFEWLNNIEQWEDAELSETELEILDKLATLWARDTYHAVASRAKQFLDLINHDNRDVRVAAIYAIAWFPNIANRALPALYTVIKQ